MVVGDRPDVTSMVNGRGCFVQPVHKGAFGQVLVLAVMLLTSLLGFDIVSNDSGETARYTL